jgi:modified peptide precursor CbpA
MKKEKIIAYRRRCRKIGTGLSHYILLSPKEEKKK